MDHSAPDPGTATAGDVPLPPALGRATGGRPPRGAREQLLAWLFAELLGLETVSADDDLFTLGGDSLVAAELAARARNAGLGMKVSEVYTRRTVAELARTAAPLPPAPGPATGGRPPRGAREQLLAWLFAQALGRKTVCADDDFFALGGDSLGVINLIKSAGKAGLVVTVKEVFAGPTVEKLARAIDAREANGGTQSALEGPWQEELEAQVLIVNSKEAANARTARERQDRTLGEWVLASTSEGRWVIEPDRISAVLGYAAGKIVSAYDVSSPMPGERPYTIIDGASGRPRVRFFGRPSRRLAHLVGMDSPTRWGRGERNPVRILPLAQLLPEEAAVENKSGRLQARLGQALVTADEAGNLIVEVPPGVDVKVVRTLDQARLWASVVVALAQFEHLRDTRPGAFDEDPELGKISKAVRLARNDMAHGIGPQPDNAELDALVAQALQVLERHLSKVHVS